MIQVCPQQLTVQIGWMVYKILSRPSSGVIYKDRVFWIGHWIYLTHRLHFLVIIYGGAIAISQLQSTIYYKTHLMFSVYCHTSPLVPISTANVPFLDS
jgi:hypothetical protein